MSSTPRACLCTLCVAARGSRLTVGGVILCESPACPSERRLSGLCEMHYWKREAERLDAIASAAVTRVDVVTVERDATRRAAVIVSMDTSRRLLHVQAHTALAMHFLHDPRRTAKECEDHLVEIIRLAGGGEIGEAPYAETAPTRHPLSLTRETVLNLTPRAATHPPTMAPPIDVAVEKEGKR